MAFSIASLPNVSTFGGFGSTFGGGGQSVSPSSNPSQYAGLILQSGNDILGLKGQAAADTMSATAQGYAVQGANIEAGTYGTAADVATNNAAVEAASQKVQAFQENRLIGSTVGSIRADTEANGFKSGTGTGMNLIRSSYQQGDLAQQIIAVNSNLAQEGYLGQALASRGEQAAASVAGSAAAALQSGYTNAAATASTEAANETAALTGLLAATGNTTGTPTNPGSATTPAAALTEAALNQNTNNLKWYQTGSGWQYGSPNAAGSSGSIVGPLMNEVVI